MDFSVDCGRCCVVRRFNIIQNSMRRAIDLRQFRYRYWKNDVNNMENA